jgi:hypothetical protein
VFQILARNLLDRVTNGCFCDNLATPRDLLFLVRIGAAGDLGGGLLRQFAGGLDRDGRPAADRELALLPATR